MALLFICVGVVFGCPLVGVWGCDCASIRGFCSCFLVRLGTRLLSFPCSNRKGSKKNSRP